MSGIEKPVRAPLPRSDVPSADVLDELLRAFSVDVNDHARLEQVDLTSPEVEELLAPGPQPRPQPEGKIEPDADHEGSHSTDDRAEPVREAEVASGVGIGPALDEGIATSGALPADAPEGGASARSGTTIVIAAKDDLPDAVYLAAGDPLLRGDAGTGGASATDEATGSQRVFIDDAMTSGDAGLISVEDATSAARIEPRLRERRIAVKRAAGRKHLRWFFVVLVLIAVIVAVLAVLGSGLFAIEHIEVEGAVYTDPVALDAVVEDLRDTPVLRADTDAAERALEAIPWVEDARVTTHFPSGLAIELRERTPAAAFRGADGGFRVIDRAGRVLDVLDSQPVDHVLITSADAPSLAPSEYAPTGFRAGAGLVEALTPEMRGLTASVAITSDGSDLRLIMTDGTEVRFGAGRDLVAKLVRLQTWLNVGRDGAVSAVDVSTDEVTTTP